MAMRNILLTLKYCGSAYHGFQVQKNALGIAQVLQDAMEAVLQSRDDIKGCSRTDAGVHANEFCVSFFTESSIPCENLIRALNTHLPYDVAVTGCREVPSDFHARYSVKKKEYIYKIYTGQTRDPFLHNLTYHYNRPLNVEMLNREAQSFVGTHDFAAFQAAGAKPGQTVRTVFDCGLERQGDMVIFHVTGDGFLYNMVRIMVGTLLLINEGKIAPGQIPNIIKAGDRTANRLTVPPQGLYLNRVIYEEGAFSCLK